MRLDPGMNVVSLSVVLLILYTFFPKEMQSEEVFSCRVFL